MQANTTTIILINRKKHTTDLVIRGPTCTEHCWEFIKVISIKQRVNFEWMIGDVALLGLGDQINQRLDFAADAWNAHLKARRPSFFFGFHEREENKFMLCSPS